MSTITLIFTLGLVGSAFVATFTAWARATPLQAVRHDDQPRIWQSATMERDHFYIQHPPSRSVH